VQPHRADRQRRRPAADGDEARRAAREESDRSLAGVRNPGAANEQLTSAAERREPVDAAERQPNVDSIAHREPTLAAILTGYTSTGGLSEAEQMMAAWHVADVPALLEVAGRNTAENASRSLPLVLALGNVRRVTVVTSAWHLRAPYHFAAWRRFGLHVRFSFDRHGDWPRMLANELRGLPRAPGERRRALAAMALPDR
jgi:hypothetical protein